MNAANGAQTAAAFPEPRSPAAWDAGCPAKIGAPAGIRPPEKKRTPSGIRKGNATHRVGADNLAKSRGPRKVSYGFGAHRPIGLRPPGKARNLNLFDARRLPRIASARRPSEDRE